MTSAQSRGYGSDAHHIKVATDLFNDGRALINKGDKSDAFKKFEAALREIEDCDGSDVEKLRKEIQSSMS